jgi:hypothetical protein
MPNETLTIDNGSLADFTIAVDVTPEGPAQIIKLAVSADGSSVRTRPGRSPATATTTRSCSTRTAR